MCPLQKYRLCAFISILNYIWTDDDGKVQTGRYLASLLEYVEIFEDVYARYSKIQVKRAVEQISELLQLPKISEEAVDFSVDEVDFLQLDMGTLYLFLSEKLSIIMVFVKLALNRRKKKLGIYFDATELGEAGTLTDEKKEHSKDLTAIEWFITGDLLEKTETYFYEDMDIGMVSDGEEQSVELAPEIHYDEANRPRK